MAIKIITQLSFFSLALFFCTMGSNAHSEIVLRQEIEDGIYSAIKGGRVIYLECHLPKGDAAKPILEKYLEQPDAWESYKGIATVAIPYFKLNNSSQRKLLESLFPDDYVDSQGWWHNVVLGSASGGESWNTIALWFTGEEKNYKSIAQSPENKALGNILQEGQVVLIPRAMLRPELSAPSPERPKKTIKASLPVSPAVLMTKGSSGSAAKRLPASMTEPETTPKTLPVSMTEPEATPKTLPASMTEAMKQEAEPLPTTLAEEKSSHEHLPQSMRSPVSVQQAKAEVKNSKQILDKLGPGDTVTVKDETENLPITPEKTGILEQSPVSAELADETEATVVSLENEHEKGDTPTGPMMKQNTDPLLNSDLSYGEDKGGAYALYKMKSGDALYSSVVVRFTDFSDNAEIHGALELIQKRSGISDPRKMTAGQSVKIPLEMLADRFHPQGSTQRENFDEIQTAVERVGTRRSIAKDLAGVVLILDPGHGGRDQGAAPWAKMGIFEDEVVYDISCRVKEIIERDTQAKIYMTTQDPNQKYMPTNATKFVHDTDEILLTTPIYPNEDARISANLRWYLANEIYRKELENGTPSDKVVFVSMHCDALYTPQLRGAMVYVPGAQYRRDSEQPGGAVYSNYKEVKQQPVVRTTYAQRVEDEALSRSFAQTLLKTLQTNDPPIMVHEAGDPIRNVIRQSGGRAYVPAVLRNTAIPTKVLVEAANLTNVTDRQRVADPEWRQHFANAFVHALRQHFAGQENNAIKVALKQ